MKIHVSVDGGLARLPGLAKPVTIDSDALPPARGRKLASLVARARFFDAAPPAPSPAARDTRAYSIAIDDGARRRALCLAEPIADPSMRDLVEAIVACAGEVRRGTA